MMRKAKKKPVRTWEEHEAMLADRDYADNLPGTRYCRHLRVEEMVRHDVRVAERLRAHS